MALVIDCGQVGTTEIPSNMEFSELNNCFLFRLVNFNSGFLFPPQVKKIIKVFMSFGAKNMTYSGRVVDACESSGVRTEIGVRTATPANLEAANQPFVNHFFMSITQSSKD